LIIEMEAPHSLPYMLAWRSSTASCSRSSTHSNALQRRRADAAAQGDRHARHVSLSARFPQWLPAELEVELENGMSFSRSVKAITDFMPTGSIGQRRGQSATV
jgi:hypothetical protein